jgi:hypothetical protein
MLWFFRLINIGNHPPVHWSQDLSHRRTACLTDPQKAPALAADPSAHGFVSKTHNGMHEFY